MENQKLFFDSYLEGKKVYYMVDAKEPEKSGINVYTKAKLCNMELIKTEVIPSKTFDVDKKLETRKTYKLVPTKKMNWNIGYVFPKDLIEGTIYKTEKYVPNAV